MMYYFTPRTANIDDVQVLNIAHAFDRAPTIMEVDGTVGPDGRPGTVFHCSPNNALPIPVHWVGTRRDDLWVGWHRTSRPGPHALRRPGASPLAATRIQLADGHWWLIPRVTACTQRDAGRQDTLGRVYVNEDGRTGMRLNPIYESVRRQAEIASEAWRGPGLQTLSADEIVDLCGAVLSVCYRIGPEEVLALELLTPRLAELVIGEAVDALEWMKANAGPGMEEAVAELDRSNATFAVVQALNDLRDEV